MTEGNNLFFGDNLDILREYIDDESVDLIYLDPPFNSQAQYNVLFQSPQEDAAAAQVEAFRDTWTWGDEAEWAYKEIMRLGSGTARFIDALRSALGESDMMAYLAMMAIRLHELRRALKETGSLYLHCDPTASHYLKILLDGIFGHKSFRNEIVWRRTGAHGRAKRWGPIHDTILFFTAGSTYTWNRVYEDYDPSYIEKFYRFTDEYGRYRLVTLDGPGIRRGSSGKPWRGVDPTDKGRHWELPPDRALPDWFEFPVGYAQMTVQERLDILDLAGLIYWPPRGSVPQYRRYLEVADGNPIQDIISDIRPIGSHSRERIGYPTQKPIALLNRILDASSNEGDTVLDPFCGCGTAIEAAQRANREWIGIDIAVHAVKVIEARLTKEFGSKVKYQSEGMPRDFESAVRLAERDKFQFQWWANYLFNPHALREQKKGADRGIDGELFFPNGPGRPWGRLLTSVKGGVSVGPSMIRDFRGVLDRENAEMGLFICLHEPTRAMKVEASSAGIADTVHGDLPRMQIVAIEEWFMGKMPSLPPLEHLPSAAFSSNKRRRPKQKRPDPSQPEFQYTFLKEKEPGAVVHFNPGMVLDTRQKRAG